MTVATVSQKKASWQTPSIVLAMQQTASTVNTMDPTKEQLEKILNISAALE